MLIALLVTILVLALMAAAWLGLQIRGIGIALSVAMSELMRIKFALGLNLERWSAEEFDCREANVVLGLRDTEFLLLPELTSEESLALRARVEKSGLLPSQLDGALRRERILARVGKMRSQQADAAIKKLTGVV